MTITVIGAGASGMAAAIAASENENTQVILLERQQRVGKKLSATGNGRCNLSNINANRQGYHGDDPSFSAFAISTFSPKDTLKWFESLGLFTMIDNSGKVYPYSEQANSVVDILRFGINKKNITLKTEFEVKRIRKSVDKFLIESDNERIQCDKVIIACGGLASAKLGGVMSGYRLLSSLGHSITKLRPSLVQLKTDWKGVTALKGVRANCTASIYKNGNEMISSTGEIQFTDYGLSGPVIFEISRDVCTGGGNWTCKLDFIPNKNSDEIYSELLRRKNTQLTTDDLLTGILHNRLGRIICKESHIKGGIPISSIEDKVLRQTSKLVKGFNLTISGVMGMDNAQVTAGGAVTDEFNKQTMESKLVKGLYACGEVLDVDGDCGGYNLQWAWSSGRLAGKSAGNVK